MAIVTAKIKNIEDMPDWVRCCEIAVREIIKHEGVVLDLDNTNLFIGAPNKCPACETIYPKTKNFRLDTRCIPFDCVDIAEGEI